MDLNNNKENFARILWRSADCVCFDVDSTVCRDEAIDELAKFANKEKQVQEITKQAMKGGLSFFEALEHRLELIQPTTQMLDMYLESHPPRFTPGIKDLVALLHLRGVDVYLVSGGFKSLIEPVAKELNIELKNVFANRLKFFFDGTYAGFDETEPTSHQDGKARVVKFLKEKYGYDRIIMVGDGSTDLAACPPADAFIGFGGNQIREKVKKEAHWFAMSFKEMIDALNLN